MKEAWMGVLRGCWQHLGAIKSAKLDVTICLCDNLCGARVCAFCVVCSFMGCFFFQSYTISTTMWNYMFECVSCIAIMPAHWLTKSTGVKIWSDALERRRLCVYN